MESCTDVPLTKGNDGVPDGGQVEVAGFCVTVDRDDGVLETGTGADDVADICEIRLLPD
jgi:hypothetical protein